MLSILWKARGFCYIEIADIQFERFAILKLVFMLVAQDVVARGIDVPTADCIVQYTAPQTDDDYLHRVGRTGRAGKSGSALIFLTHEEQEYISHLAGHRVLYVPLKPLFICS